MNVSFDLFTELIGYRFFIQQRVLDDVAFRIGHHDVVVGNFDIFARFLPIFHTFEEDITGRIYRSADSRPHLSQCCQLYNLGAGSGNN